MTNIERDVWQWGESLDAVKHNEKQFYELMDIYTEQMLSKYSPLECASVMRTFLLDYQLPVNPTKIKLFERFHEQVGPTIYSLAEADTEFEIPKYGRRK